VVALGGVVVDHVEDDLDAGAWSAHHRLELAHRPADRLEAVPRSGAKKASVL
jgi:hypothetical protein